MGIKDRHTESIRKKVCKKQGSGKEKERGRKWNGGERERDLGGLSSNPSSPH